MNCFVQVEDKTRFPSNLTTSTMQLLENQHSKPRDPTLSMSKQVIDTRRPSERLEDSTHPFPKRAKVYRASDELIEITTYTGKI
jgi:hypothetical protein